MFTTNFRRPWAAACVASILTLCSSMSYAQDKNLWQDSDFEQTGEAIPNPHSGAKVGKFSITHKNHWDAYQNVQMGVEPFAVYEAKAFVRRDPANSGYAQALLAYGWDSFGWSFMAAADVPATDQWTHVSTHICVPANIVNFCPLAIGEFQGDGTFTAYIDDLEFVKILSGEEHIAKLQQKAASDLNNNECELLARYLLKENRLDEMDKLRLATSHDHARADIACLLAKRADTSAAKVPFVADMICHGGLNLAEGKQRLEEFLQKLSVEDDIAVCIAAIRQGGDWDSIRNGVEQVRQLLENRNTYAAPNDLQYILQDLAAAKDALAAPQREEGESLLNALTDNVKAMQGTLREQQGSRVVTISGVPLTADGTAIVLPQNPTPSERHAARELNHFLYLITGLNLQIVDETAPLPPRVICIGRNAKAAEYGFDVDYAKLGLEGIHIESANGNLMLAGGKRGVLYAVYHFLEDYLGCQWFTPDCDKIPNSGRVDLGDFRKVYVPPLEYRDTDSPVCRPMTFGVRNQLNGLYSLADEAWGEHIMYRGFVHTFFELVPPAQYAKDHPEYYSEINGKRVVDKSQLCLTNPDVKRIATETVRRWMQEHPEATIFSVSQNDWHNYCTCRNCRELAEKEGSQAGPLLHFVNHIADAVRDEFPDKIVDTLAYQYTRKPPKFVKPVSNVCVRLCSIECCFVHPLENCTFNKTFVDDIIGWSKICNRLHIWDYVINYAHSIQPFPNLKVLKPNIKFFVNHGVTGIYEESSYFSQGCELSELRTYMLAKLLWDPSYDDNKAIEDFTDAYYGPAGAFIRQYLDTIHTICDQDGHVGIYAAPGQYLTDKDMLQKASECLEKAKDAVKDNPTLLQRVELVSLPLLYTNIEMDTALLHRDGNTLTYGKSSQGALLEEFTRIAKQAKVTQVSEGTMLDEWLKRKHAMEKDPIKEIVTLESPFILMELLPSMGGRIWRAVHKASGHEILRVVGNDEAGFTPKDAGYEEYNSEEYRGGGYYENYQVVEATSSFAVLRCQFEDGVIATRTISLLPDQPGFRVTTQYNAVSDSHARCCRNHPEFNVINMKDATLFIKKADGSILRTTVPWDKKWPDDEIWYRDEDIPAGEWGIQFPLNGKTATLTCRFDPATVKTCYVNVCDADSRFNLEEWTTDMPVTPTSGPRLSNTYLFTLE